MNKRIIQVVAFLLMVYVSYQAFENPFSQDYMATMNNTALPVTNAEESLYAEITERAEDYNIKPQDAQIHKVWRKMPGLNGLKVDIEKSFEKMKKKGSFDESLLVYQEVEPDVKLKDLPESPIYRGHPDKQMVSFLINVSWGEDYIPSILNTLKKHEVKATFFVEGKWAQKHMDLVKMIQEEGHEIGNHAYNHPDMNRISNTEIREQIVKTNNIIEAITGETPIFFAPPSGSYNDQVVKIANELEMETILWSVDTIDWKKPSTSVMINRVMGKIHNGAMILMHPTEPVSKGLDQLILKIKEKSYKIGNVPTLLSEKRS